MPHSRRNSGSSRNYYGTTSMKFYMWAKRQSRKKDKIVDQIGQCYGTASDRAHSLAGDIGSKLGDKTDIGELLSGQEK